MVGGEAMIKKKEKNRLIKETATDKVFNIINHIFLLLALIITLYPLIYVLSASISDPAKVSTGQMWLFPMGITFEGYERVFKNSDIWLGYANTIFYTVTGTIFSLALTLPAAYALAKRDLVGRGFVSALFTFTMFFGGGLIPLFIQMKNMNLLDSRTGIILLGGASFMNIIITRTFIQSTIPQGLEEAAEIDGCSPFGKFFKIVLPLSAPIIAVMALYYGVGRWNSYFNEMIFLTTREKFPLQVFLREILIITQMNQDKMTTAEAQALAEQSRVAELIKYGVMIVSTLPIICVYPFLQRYFVKGVMIGSIKG